MRIIEDGDIVSQVFVPKLQRLAHLSFVLINAKEDGFDSINIASKVFLRDIQALALCTEAGKGSDGNGGAKGCLEPLPRPQSPSSWLHLHRSPQAP